jgi:hypothetical protein
VTKEQEQKAGAGRANVFLLLPSAPIPSNFLRQNRGLAPANRLLWWKTILMHDAEVLLCFVNHFLRWMALKTKQYFEKNTGDSRMHREV